MGESRTLVFFGKINIQNRLDLYGYHDFDTPKIGTIWLSKLKNRQISVRYSQKKKIFDDLLERKCNLF